MPCFLHSDTCKHQAMERVKTYPNRQVCAFKFLLLLAAFTPQSHGYLYAWEFTHLSSRYNLKSICDKK
ncbi:hypothetical protein XBFFR1_2360011 [Xenorhabdus bovienii str. feltiae France]|nr:hypothetical protein XBFFR1_2360011 [Xenorhabdus bovienii str. feltiae France]